MGNDFVIIPPHDFKEPSYWYERATEAEKYAFRVITYGMKSITNATEILAEII
jgi:hypothetical protein